MGETSIEWTDRSINPIRARDPITGAIGHYCEMFSSGCLNCYASTLQKRFRMPKFPGKPREPSTNKLSADDTIWIRDLEVFLDDSKLKEVLRRKKPTKWFWCDMTDMFGSWIPDSWLDRIFAVMEQTPQHTHQVLTKRPERMAEYTGWRWGKREDGQGHRIPARNIWLGTSVENERQCDIRIEALTQCPAALRFVSFEPLLEGVDPGFRNWADSDKYGIGWVIIGGESGRHARPCNLEWIRFLIKDCRLGGVACFVKQLGAKVFEETTQSAADVLFPAGVPGNVVCEGVVQRRREFSFEHSKAGDMTEWPADLRVRDFP